jgi:hypothetical protein
MNEKSCNIIFIHNIPTWIASGKIIVSKLQRTQQTLSINGWMKSQVGIPFVYKNLHEKVTWTINCNTIAPSYIWVTCMFNNIRYHIQPWVIDVIVAMCPIAFVLYKDHELQMSITIEKFNCKPNYKSLDFPIVVV